MNAVLVSKENTEVKFTMAFSAEEFTEACKKAYQQDRNQFVIDGFRKGKAPMSIIEKKYGESIFFEKALDNMLQEGYPVALDELGIKPVDYPSIEFGEEKLEKGKGVEIKVTVTVAPEIVVKDYKGVKAEIAKITVTDEDVEKELKNLQKKNARLVSVEREAQNGDTVVLDYAGFCGEEQFEGGTAENQTLVLGSNTFIPGFEEQLVGCKAGDAKDVNVTFPAEYHADNLAGKEAVFKCTVHEVKTEELPELDDEFVKDVSEEFDTMEELKADTKAKLEKNAADAKEFQGKDAVLAKVVDANDFEIPAAMIKSEAQTMLQEFGQQLAYQGMNLEMYCKYLNKTQEEMAKEFEPDAEKRVKTKMIVEAVAKQEGIDASEEDIQNELEAMAKQYNMELDQMKKIFGEENYGYLKADICNRKAIDFMYENAEITEVEPKEKAE